MSDAQFIDSSMLHVLVGTDTSARAHGKDFRIQLGTEAIVKRVFQISGVLDVVPWAPSRDEVLNGSRPGVKDESGGSDEAGA